MASTSKTKRKISRRPSSSNGSNGARNGPRPLALHLGTEFLTCHSLGLNFQNWLKGGVPFHRSLESEARNLAREAQNLNPSEQNALLSEIQNQAKNALDDMMAGIRLYHHQPSGERKERGDIIWQQGNITLYDCGAKTAKAKPVFLIPSLINRADILDLMPERSFIQFLKSQGFRPLLLDWGEPGAAESGFGMDEYAEAMLQAFDEAASIYPKSRPAVVGYCMGGIFAALLADRRAKKCGGLVLVATPWDFHAAYADRAKIDHYVQHILPLLQPAGIVPVDVLQAMFYDIDPFASVNKFQKLGREKMSKAELKNFTALEDWVNDGVPLSYNVMHTAMRDWYQANRLVKRQYKILGSVLDAGKIKTPALVLVPQQDKIVPPASAFALAAQLPDAQAIAVETGHIGLMAGEAAQRQTWPKIASWLKRI